MGIYGEKLLPLRTVFKCSNNQKTLKFIKFHGYTHPFLIKSATIFFPNFIPECIVPKGLFLAKQTDENVMFLLSLSVLSTACQKFKAS